MIDLVRISLIVKYLYTLFYIVNTIFVTRKLVMRSSVDNCKEYQYLPKMGRCQPILLFK